MHMANHTVTTCRIQNYLRALPERTQAGTSLGGFVVRLDVGDQPQFAEYRECDIKSDGRNK